MANSSSSSSSSGIGFFGLLTILFIALKLLGLTAVAHWSWWWVTLPIWGPLALLLVGFVLFLLYEALFNRKN